MSSRIGQKIVENPKIVEQTMLLLWRLVANWFARLNLQAVKKEQEILN